MICGTISAKEEQLDKLEFGETEYVFVLGD
jgi:hypothetical protein